MFFAGPNDNRAAPPADPPHQAPGRLPRARIPAIPKANRPPSSPLGAPIEIKVPQHMHWAVHHSVSPPHTSFPTGTPLTGRTAHSSQMWHLITMDSWVLHIVSRFSLEFTFDPIRTRPPPTPDVSDKTSTALIDTELESFLTKGAIELSPSPPVFVSIIFLECKKTGDFHLVFNLRALNTFILYHNFKMEGIHLLRYLLLKGDWSCHLDLQEAYLTAPIHVQHCSYLPFHLRSRLWHFNCLPFGHSSAPWCFKKLLKPVLAFFRTHGVRSIIYLDNILLFNSDPSCLWDQTH